MNIATQTNQEDAMKNLAPENIGELACSDCFNDYRLKSMNEQVPCKANLEEDVHGGDQCARCGEQAKYRVLFFVNGVWQ